MRWGIFIVASLVVIALDKNFVGALELFGTKPTFFGCLCVFVALSASRGAALWGCFALGLLLDLLEDPQHYGDLSSAVYLIGPYTLGCVFGCNIVLPIRTMVFRRNPLTIGVLTFCFVLSTSVVYVAIGVIRSWYPEDVMLWEPGGALTALGNRFFVAVYSGLLAIPVGWLLVRTTPLWGFQPGHQR